MIFDEPLSPERQASSRRNFNIFNLINGLSYMCLGETVIILLAVRLHCPDSFIAALGAMLYFGYLLLPLGKITTARVGAASSQALFWVLRNVAALLVAASAVISLYWSQPFGMAVLLTGAFLFYGFRAAGVVMSQPLYGDITTNENRAAFLAATGGLFYCSCLIALTIISLLLHVSQSLWTLTGIIVVGATLGFSSSRFIRKVDETSHIRRSAAKPIRGELLMAFRNPVLRRQIMAGFAINLGVIMLVPVSMLTLKRGYGVSDTEALLYALVQFAASALMSFLAGRVAERIGPRHTILAAYALLLGVAVLWLCAPASFHWYYMILPFLLAGGATVSMSNSMIHYFLQTVPVENRVGSSMFIAVINGSGAGLAGMLLAGSLLRNTVESGVSFGGLAGYRLYFLGAVLVLSPGLWIIRRLKPLPLEKRRILKSWSSTAD